MDAMSDKGIRMKTEKEKTLEIAKIVQDFKGGDVAVIDVSHLNSWTDYFIITTVN
ncbi:MAG TPA: RsfS/YbeB/iojap family protein, partial [Treponemataceae bacterium]|nr:RsfS/YbeB/iojap family protein [Treponemataceae bacterium]